MMEPEKRSGNQPDCSPLEIFKQMTIGFKRKRDSMELRN